MPIQQMLLGVGAKKKTYMDDVFNNYLWRGNSTDNRAINVGFDYTTDEGLVWIKNRQDSDPHCLFDTLRGANKRLATNSNSAETTTSVELKSFTSTGYTLGTDGTVNGNTKPFASWNFKSAPSFFDVVTYTGNGSSPRQISHNLGANVGMTIVKCTSNGNYWHVLHRDGNAAKTLFLNRTDAEVNDTTAWNSTHATSTNFTVGASLNVNGRTYVAYLFAGGESTAATARSVNFSAGSGNYLQVQSTSTDLEMGSSDFTLEMWINSEGVTSSNRNFFSLGNPVQIQQNVTGNKIGFFFKDDGGNWFINNTTSPSIADGTWNHVAVTRSGNTWRLFLNGIQFYTETHDVTVDGLGGNYPSIGSYNSGSNAYGFNGKISNVRFVKGTAVYTSSFRPPTEPLTNITNTKLLCCNNSSVTGSTVSPGTLAQNGNTASTDSPFDDPAVFTFGENGDQNVIKCGSYVGNGSTDGPEINLGWEPQWILLKNASASQGWRLFDSMRGIPTGGSDARLFPNNSDAESDAADYIDLTSTGFKLKDNGSDLNGDGDTLTYVAIRRADGYVGKPAEAGTDVFAMDTGNSSSTEAFTSGFPVDYVLSTNPSSTSEYNWETGGRLIQGKYLYTHNSDVEASHANFDFTSNTGWSKNSGYNSSYQSWMWKRHAGFTISTYKGDAVSGRQITHDMNKTPEFMIVKSRGYADGWIVYHKGMNGGTNPQNYYMQLQTNAAEAAGTGAWNDTAPTSSHFTVGNWAELNRDGYNFIALLFASVDGISKVGSYTGNGVKTGNVQTLGFQPRFILIKCADTASTNWMVFDTLLGINSGDDNFLSLNTTTDTSAGDFIDLTSDGFDVVEDLGSINGNNKKYIYYAHA